MNGKKNRIKHLRKKRQPLKMKIFFRIRKKKNYKKTRRKKWKKINKNGVRKMPKIV